jgi:hypothetical protein
MHEAVIDSGFILEKSLDNTDFSLKKMVKLKGT